MHGFRCEFCILCKTCCALKHACVCVRSFNICVIKWPQGHIDNNTFSTHSIFWCNPQEQKLLSDHKLKEDRHTQFVCIISESALQYNRRTVLIHVC